MDACSYYQRLVKKFPEGEMGRGLEPGFPGISDQPMTYGLLLSSESIYYKKQNDKSSMHRIQELANWLIENSDLDEDGIPAWGLPHEWDAYQDGSINTANHPYTITTSIVLNGFLDALSIENVIDVVSRRKIFELMKIVSLYWCKNVWTAGEDGGFFWYSPSKTDSHFTANVSAMFLGTLSRILAEHGYIFNVSQYLFVKGRMNAAAKAIIATVVLEEGIPKWYYTIKNGSEGKGKFNDVIHHGYILWGMERYRTFGGKYKLPWTVEQSLASMDGFIVDDHVVRFQHNHNKPARLWGAGMALAFYAKYANQGKANHLIQIIDQDYGPFPDLLYYPKDRYQDKSFYPRFAAHVLWGLALCI